MKTTPKHKCAGRLFRCTDHPKTHLIHMGTGWWFIFDPKQGISRPYTNFQAALNAAFLVKDTDE